MSNFSIHKAALEGARMLIWLQGIRITQGAQLTRRPGQPGLVRSILSEDPKLINAKDAVSPALTHAFGSRTLN